MAYNIGWTTKFLQILHTLVLALYNTYKANKCNDTKEELFSNILEILLTFSYILN